MKKPSTPQSAYNRLVVALIILIVGLAVLTVLYMRALNEVDHLKAGGSSILNSSPTFSSPRSPSISGEMN